MSSANARAQSSVRWPWAIFGSVAVATVSIGATEIRTGPFCRMAPGRRILTSSGKFHVMHRPGDGPTVLMENGLSMTSPLWSWVCSSLPEGVPFIAYDRLGTGWSDAAPKQWRERYPHSLSSLLETIEASPPFVLVGHSLGSLLVRNFARTYPTLVAGLVLVDPSNPRQHDLSQAHRDGFNEVRDDLRRRMWRSALMGGSTPRMRSILSGLPESQIERTALANERAGNLRTAIRELELSRTRWAELASMLTSISPKPLAIITAEQTHRTHPEYSEYITELSGLSTRHRTEMVEGATHTSLLARENHAKSVTDAVGWVLENHSAESLSTTSSS